MVRPYTVMKVVEDPVPLSRTVEATVPAPGARTAERTYWVLPELDENRTSTSPAASIASAGVAFGVSPDVSTGDGAPNVVPPGGITATSSTPPSTQPMAIRPSGPATSDG